jgi:GNAT superfamily N-acetyltransferase
MNVVLRQLRGSDAVWLDSWLSQCAVSVGYDAIDADAPGRSLLNRADDDGTIARVIIAGGEDIGVVVYGGRDGGMAVIEFVGVQPSYARRGYGHKAAELVEDELRSVGATVIDAPAPSMHGIAVYFWIRLGYRPMQQADWPCRRDGIAWMRRELR